MAPPRVAREGWEAEHRWCAHAHIGTAVILVRLALAVIAIALGVSAPPLVSDAQPAGKAPRIGVLLFGTPESDPNLSAFRDGLRDLGYTEGRNIVLEFRFADSKAERLAGLAAELAN